MRWFVMLVVLLVPLGCQPRRPGRPLLRVTVIESGVVGSPRAPAEPPPPLREGQ